MKLKGFYASSRVIVKRWLPGALGRAAPKGLGGRAGLPTERTDRRRCVVAHGTFG